MKRRNFMLLVSAGVVAVSVPFVNQVYFDIPDYDKESIFPQFLSLIWDEESISDIGAKYAAKFPEESRERSLAKALFSDSASQSKDKLLALTQSDFFNGNLVTIDGWVLSKTEARQCALHYIMNQTKA
ncbi:hypothetical protein [Pararhodonellum marinum]|uniref:hypothetical protein n=1 Tax=Pararhodonellum marinum TaxID=2755358 RepID=UPI0018900D0B|nr:hypothetical protein [Pararhodonellum marinum]